MTGGAGGTAGASGAGVGGTNGGTAGTSGSVWISGCSWGDEAVHASPIGLGTDLAICIDSYTEYRFRFKITTPDAPPGGGYVIVSFRNVSSDFTVDVEVTPSTDSYALDTFQSADFPGDDFDTWFAATPGAQFFIDVSDLFGGFVAPLEYTMSAAFVAVDDAFEPNDTQANAKPIALGSSVQAFAFAGYGATPSVVQTGWYDWFKVTLPAGTPSLTLSGASPDFSLDVSLDDPNSDLGYAATGATLSSGSVTISPSTPLAAGDYFVIVEPTSSNIDAYGSGGAAASYATTPYTLVVNE